MLIVDSNIVLEVNGVQGHVDRLMFDLQRYFKYLEKFGIVLLEE